MFYLLAKKLRLLLAKICRPLYCVVFGRDEDSWICTRYICNYLYGVFIAWLLWKILLPAFCLSMKTEFIVLAIFIIFFGIGFVFSITIKCLTLLVCVALLGKSGRGYLRALSFALVIAGPIENLATNGQEVIRAFACATTLTYNLTKTRYDLMTKPFRKTLSSMKDEVSVVRNTFEEMRGVIKPIREEVEGADEGSNTTKSETKHFVRKLLNEAEQVQIKYKKTFEKRCKKQLNAAEKRCGQSFKDAHNNCLDKFPPIIRSLLCWPFRVDFICRMNILGDPDKICDPSDAIPSNFGENYVNMKLTENKLYANDSEVKVNYKVHKAISQPTLQSAENTAKAVVKEFNTRKLIFDHIMEMMETFLSFLFLRIIYSSIQYHRKYKSEIDFDNVYISDYFKHVDNRRKLASKRSLMPIKKYEKKYLVNTNQICARTKKESMDMIFYFMQFSLEIVAACFFLLFDYLIVHLLDIIHSKALISYEQEGEHTIKFEVNGNGLMARLLRSTLRNFNMHETVSTTLTNEQCLPNASVLPKRLRRLICGYFYRSREKKRILYLYNSLLSQRRALFQMMLKDAEWNIDRRNVRKRLNLFLRLRMECPKSFDWLKWFKCARHKCLICDDFEDDKFVICDNEICAMVYCNDCWHDIGLRCVACKKSIQNIRILNFN